MITIKKPEEIDILREGGHKLADILRALGEAAEPGINTAELNDLAEDLIEKMGGEPAFRHYGDPPFPSSICASVNEELVHAPASKNKILKDGDILSIDIGMRYPKTKGFYTDHAATFAIGNISAEAKKLISVTNESLARGIGVVRPGNYIHDIGKAVQEYAEGEGYSVIRALVGHGVGYGVHEDPRIPNYYDPNLPKMEIKEGMVLAIEPMISSGSYEIETLSDKWTVIMADKKLCAHFEHTVAVTKNGAEILTK